MTVFGSWESYLYPPPDHGTLRNKPGLRDPDKLRRFEYAAVQARQFELMNGVASVDKTFDAAHVRQIHAYLFQDVFEWAGEYRRVNMSKGGSPGGFADVGAGQIDRYLGDMSRLVQGADWARLDRSGFGQAAADVFAHLNQAHPFREGNGRTSKIFMEHVAEQSEFTLDYARVSPLEWNNASAMSAPDLGSYPVFPESLVPVFTKIAVERTSAPASAEAGAERARGRNPNIAYAPGRGPAGSPSAAVAKPYIPRGVARGKDQGMER